MQMQFGKYKGFELSEVPEDYLDWMRRDAQEKIKMVDDEFLRRKARVEGSMMKQIVDKGFTELKTSVIDPSKLKQAYDALCRAISDAAQPKSQSTTP